MQKSPGVELVLDPNEGSGISICVEDCGDFRGEEDTFEDTDWSYGESNPSRNKWKIAPTSLPPLHASVC
jgi:calcipressin-2